MADDLICAAKFPTLVDAELAARKAALRAAGDTL
jgi:hypothetical protein